jgi:predicted RNA-binding protein YlxR (DUF448 family)
MTDEEHGDDEMPERMCIVTREVKEPGELIRFVADPEGKVVPDLRAVLPGRGVWVTATATMVAEARTRRLFARGLKAKVEADAELEAKIAHLLRKQALSSLSLANKAGLVVAGHDKVDEIVAGARARLLIEANDAAPNGVDRMRRKALAVRPQGLDVISCFTSAELGLALGRTNVIHAAVAEGGLAEKLALEALRVEAFGQKATPAG